MAFVILPFLVMFSPHAWGWTLGERLFNLQSEVFPTRVGVDLSHGLETSRMK